MTHPRWQHLARHGLIGSTLLAASAGVARAEPCEAGDRAVGLFLGVDLAPALQLRGGLEARACVGGKAEMVVRGELGGGARLLLGALARPLADAPPDQMSYDERRDNLGLELGLVLSTRTGPRGHVAASYGPMWAYVAAHARFGLSGAPATTLGVDAAFAPAAALGSTVIDGRPLTVHGRAVRPGVVPGAGAPSDAEGRAAAAHFQASAQTEYSSVWAFLRLARELAAVGAPAALVAAALDAADDEVRHAELCAAAAGACGLMPLAAELARPRFTHASPVALATLAREAWFEGCLGEGWAAEEARLTATEAVGDAVARLNIIAADEARHAELSWRVLGWLRSIDPGLVRAALGTAPAWAAPAPVVRDRALVRLGVPAWEVSRYAHAQVEATATERLAALIA